MDKKIKLLLIEDSADDAILIKRKLESSPKTHYAISAVKTLEDGLACITADAPDLIISDLGLPDSHGLDTVKRILEHAPHIPLVVLSGFDDESVAIKAVQAGAQDYLVKGQIENPQMERALHYSIERARLLAEIEKHHQEAMTYQANMHKILDKNADAILVIGRDKRILFTNPATAELMGRKQKELLKEIFKYELSTGKTIEIEIEQLDKKIKTADMSAVDIDWEGNPAYLVSIHDITQRKEMETALKNSEEKFAAVFRSSPDIIIIADLKTGKFIEVNESLTRVTGYTREETIGHVASDFKMWAYPEDEAKLDRLFKEHGGYRQEEFSYRMKSGEIRQWLSSAEIFNIGNDQCVMTVSMDITERKRMEDKLRFSDIVLRSIREGVMVIDTNHKITYWNDICEQMFSVKTSDAIGKLAINVIHAMEDYEGQNAAHLESLLKKGFNREEQRYRTQHGDIWADVQVQAIEYNGTQYGWLTLLSDITARKKIEEALKQSETKYRELIDSSSDAIISAGQDMAVTIWNKGAEKIFGYSEKEMLGQPVMKIVPDFMRKGMTEGFDTFTKTGTSRIINQMLDLIGIGKGDRRIPIELSVSSRKAGDAYIATAIIRDITRRKEAENALKTSEEKYRELINTSNDAIVSVDSQMQFMLWNQGAEKMLGYTEKEMLGLSLLTIFPETSQKSVAKELVLLKQTGTSNTINKPFETNLLKKDCSLVPVEMAISTRMSDGNIISTAIMRDITIRKEAMKKVRESEERYRDLFENATDLIQSCNAEGKFVYVNKAWRMALGYSEEEVLNLVLWDIMHPDHVAQCKETLQRVLEGETVNNIETAFMAKDGKIINVEGNVNPVRKDDKVIATRAIFRDINVRKEAEEKLKQIDQMKSEFLSNVSHELRTPLQSISGFTKLIMNGDVPEKETQQEFLQIIDRETSHLGNLINSLLDMSRLESGRFQINRRPMDMRDTITESLKMFQSLAHQKNIELTENIPDTLPEMNLDIERIRQVIVNLLSNAVKFSDPGSSVKIKAETTDNELIFQVADHGTGIREENMKHLFERFYREEGEKVRGGTGLGLYISKQIIDAHGGRIWAESKAGEGSTFSFALPLNGKVFERKGVNEHG